MVQACYQQAGSHNSKRIHFISLTLASTHAHSMSHTHTHAATPSEVPQPSEVRQEEEQKEEGEQQGEQKDRGDEAQPKEAQGNIPEGIVLS